MTLNLLRNKSDYNDNTGVYFNGDCLEVMKSIPDNSVDMVLCDLPYGTTYCKWDTIIPFEPLWNNYHRIVKDNGVIVLFSAQPFTTKLIHSNLKNYRYNWYWKKNTTSGFAYARYQPMRNVEDICVFYKQAGRYKPQGLIKVDKPKMRKKNTIDGIYSKTLNDNYVTSYKNYPKHLLEFNKEFGHHPTQKPVALLEYLIKTYTSEGELVLDNCMGSGSTGVACKNTNRQFIGIELEEKYFNIAVDRIKEVDNGIY